MINIIFATFLFAIVLFAVVVYIVWIEGKDNARTKSMQNVPVSEDLEEAAKHYLYSNILYDDVYVGNPTDKDCIEMFKAGAKWQKERIMANSTNATICLPYENRYGGYTHLIDVPRPLPVGNNKIAIIFKED